MGAQVQELKKQRRLLAFASSVLALMVFVAGIYAFVQRGIAVEKEQLNVLIRKLANEARVECEQHSTSLMKQLQEKEKQLTQARAEAALLKEQTREKRNK
jgi:flagellar biosynthesis component FlhA